MAQGFTWKQRLQILFGYAIRIEVELLMLHDPGRMSQKLTLATTPNQDPKEEVRQ